MLSQVVANMYIDMCAGMYINLDVMSMSGSVRDVLCDVPFP